MISYNGKNVVKREDLELFLIKKRGLEGLKRGKNRGGGGGGGGGGYLNNTLLGRFCRTVLAGRWGGTVENNGDRKHFCTKKPSKTVNFTPFCAKKPPFLHLSKGALFDPF